MLSFFQEHGLSIRVQDLLISLLDFVPHPPTAPARTSIPAHLLAVTMCALEMSALWYPLRSRICFEQQVRQNTPTNRTPRVVLTNEIVPFFFLCPPRVELPEIKPMIYYCMI